MIEIYVVYNLFHHEDIFSIAKLVKWISTILGLKSHQAFHILKNVFQVFHVFINKCYKASFEEKKSYSLTIFKWWEGLNGVPRVWRRRLGI